MAGQATCRLLALLLISKFSFASSPAKNYPGSPDFPSSEAFSELASSVGDRLKKCNGNGDSAACGVEPLRAEYAMIAKSAEDVSRVVSFASKNNLRVTVRNTGHDFLARHSGAGGITISTSEMKGAEWTDAWTPKAGSARFTQHMKGTKTKAIVLGAGNTFSDIGMALKPKGQQVVQGADPTVGISGWVMGGGHGPYTSVYGLGCDNVLEMDVVLTNGSIVTANSDSYSDLFWALLGGGASTYGITTSITLRTFDAPAMNPVSVKITGEPEKYLDSMAHFFAMTPNMSDFGLTGYPRMTRKEYSGMLMAPGKTAEEVLDFMKPIVEKMRSYGAEVSIEAASLSGAKSPSRTFGWLEDPIRQHWLAQRRYQKRQELDYLPVHNKPVDTMVSRLLSRQALRVENQPAIRAMLANMTGYLLPYGNIGGAVTKNRNLDIGLNPAWRDAVMHLISINYAIESNVKAMGPLSAEGASYWNEGLDKEREWKRVYFGKNYPKLLEVKKKYDPQNTLWCVTCVGYDVFEEVDGKLFTQNR